MKAIFSNLIPSGLRILLMFAGPVILLVYFLTQFTASKLDDLKIFREFEASVNYSVKLSSLLNELQKERFFATLYQGSQGRFYRADSGRGH